MPLLFSGMLTTQTQASPYMASSAGFAQPANSEATVSGVVHTNVAEYKRGVPISVGLGIASGAYRLEGTLGYQSNPVYKRLGVVLSGSDLSLLSAMANGYRDFRIGYSTISPYLMAGLGGARVNILTGSTSRVNQNVFAWQIGAGAGVKVSDRVTLDLSGRYYKTGDVTDSSGSTPVTFTVSGIKYLVGARVNF
ncbi:MAG: outer membrane beta-barrel protein [Chlorobium sp.]